MSRSSYVQKQQKTLPYTVSEIGGKAELEAWKLEQIKKEEAYQLKMAPIREARRQAAIAMVENQEVNPYKHTEADLQELEYRTKKLNWLRGKLNDHPLPRREVEAPLSAWQKIKKVCGF